MKKFLPSLIFLLMMHHPVFAVISSQISPPSTTAQYKYVKIDNSPSSLKYISMNTAGGCSNFDTGDIKYVQIGVTQMPNVNYTTARVSGEFDLNFSQTESPCVTYSSGYNYYSDGSWMWWVDNFGTAQMVCAPVTVEWK